MFEKEIMISSVRRQKEILDDLIRGLEQKDVFRHEDFQLYDATLRKIETTMRRLRRNATEYESPMHGSAGKARGLIRRILN